MEMLETGRAMLAGSTSIFNALLEVRSHQF